jgi:hypothetical protein
MLLLSTVLMSLMQKEDGIDQVLSLLVTTATPLITYVPAWLA